MSQILTFVLDGFPDVLASKIKISIESSEIEPEPVYLRTETGNRR